MKNKIITPIKKIVVFQLIIFTLLFIVMPMSKILFDDYLIVFPCIIIIIIVSVYLSAYMFRFNLLYYLLGIPIMIALYLLYDAYGVYLEKVLRIDVVDVMCIYSIPNLSFESESSPIIADAIFISIVLFILESICFLALKALQFIILMVDDFFKKNE